MSGKTASSAILLLILGNFAATFCDAFIKMAGADVPIFQFTFMRCVCMLLCLLPFIGQVDWSNPLEGVKLHFTRGCLWVITTILLVMSLAKLPLATANAVFYTAPLLITLLAAVVYKEKLSSTIIFAAVLGFIGILIILRPTVMNIGMISALLFAVGLAASSLLIRKLPKGQSLFHGMLLTHLCALPFAGGLALFEGADWNWSLVRFAMASSICSIIYGMSCLLAYRFVASSEIASAEYSGLIFAMILGWLLFDENVDLFVGIGAFFIITPLAYISHRDNKKRRLLLAQETLI
ncbi:DMT family transporter [Marinomonas algicola]|uniref:DMT family transporter n=1 Tax=Marinomonas algicola TaxID=2773454 RepID=UPI00174A72C1|nr:DMT family transporter [Marinomonas algicola]